MDSVSVTSEAHSFMIIVMIFVALSGNSRLNSEVSITIWSVLIMLHKNYKKPELKKLRRKLVVNHAIRPFLAISSVEVIMAFSS